MMDVSSCDCLDTACISSISANLMLRRWASELNWILLLLQILLRSHGFRQEVAGAELSSVEVVVVAAELELGSEPDSEADFQGI